MSFKLQHCIKNKQILAHRGTFAETDTTKSVRLRLRQDHMKLKL